MYRGKSDSKSIHSLSERVYEIENTLEHSYFVLITRIAGRKIDFSEKRVSRRKKHAITFRGRTNALARLISTENNDVKA